MLQGAADATSPLSQSEDLISYHLHKHILVHRTSIYWMFTWLGLRNEEEEEEEYEEQEKEDEEEKEEY